MPTVAVTAHRMLNHLASLRMTIELLEDESLGVDRRMELGAVARRKVAELEEALRVLITAPRDVQTEVDRGP